MILGQLKMEEHQVKCKALVQLIYLVDRVISDLLSNQRKSY